MNNNNAPIGVIDSGLGGLSVLQHLISDIPNESYIYFSDNAYCPYGKKSFAEIQSRVFDIVRFLIDKYNVKLVVVACNTATAAAIDELRANFPIPFVGMEPAIKPAALKTKTGVIGVLATEGTFNGRLFKNTYEKYATEATMIVTAGNNLVEYIEAGIVDGTDIENLLKNYIDPMVTNNADLLVLGCTHFPLLSDTIKTLYPKLNLIDPAPAISKQTLNILKINDIESASTSGNRLFFTSGDPILFNQFLKFHLSISEECQRVDI
ncbi:MAG: glutamate racemase [Salinivirgaceae bacterium]|nr:glutamate racemase [Salinivirgaceae bacterium]